MGKYLVEFSQKAIKDLQVIKKSGRKLDMKRIQTFLLELQNHPKT